VPFEKRFMLSLKYICACIDSADKNWNKIVQIFVDKAVLCF